LRKKWFGVVAVVLALMVALAGCAPRAVVTPPQPPIRIGALASLSGALQDYGQQMRRGFELGLKYATDGTMEVAGRKIEVIWEDTTTVPDVARERAKNFSNKTRWTFWSDRHPRLMPWPYCR